MNDFCDTHRNRFYLRLFLFSIFSFGLFISPVRAENLNFSTYDLPPFVGKSLARQGVLTEIISEAFKASGNAIDLNYYPAKRAIFNAKKGRHIGVFPLIYDPALEKDFIFSAPVPGMNPGLLQKKSKSSDKSKTIENKVIGIEAGSLPFALREAYKSHKFVEINTNEQLLKMLYLDRIDYILIDQYTAADLMVDKLPNMIGELEFVENSIIPVNFHIGFSKLSPLGLQAEAAFQIGLKKITASGKLNEILYDHGLLVFENNEQKKILRIATVENQDMIIMQQLSTLYEKQHTDVKLEWRVLDETIMRRRLLSDLAVSDGQYDVMTIGAYETPIWSKRNWLIPFDSLPESYEKNDLIKNIRESLSLNDHLFALPFYGESTMTYYRKDLFEKANISMPDTPSWEQIRSFAEKIHDPENGVYGICLRGKTGWGENGAVITAMINTFGGQWFDMDWQPQIDTTEWKNALSLYVDLVTHYGPLETLHNGYVETLQLFAEGRCGIWMDATVAASTLYNPKKSRVADVVGYAASPHAVMTRGSQWLWIWSLAVPASSRHQKEAQEFITWATSEEYIRLVAEAEGWNSVPPGTRYSTYENKRYTSAAPFAEFVLQEIENSRPNEPTLKPSPYSGLAFVAIPEFPALGAYVGDKINQVLRGNLTLDKALKDSQKFARSKMKEAGYYQ